MDVWSHLILNHLTHASHASWAGWLRPHFQIQWKWAGDLLEIIHADACDPMRIEACGGYRYFLIFTEDLSRYRYIYLMKHKSETFEKFKQFQSEVENHHNKKIKFLRSDQGESIWVMSLAITKDKVEPFQVDAAWNTIRNVCPNVVIEPYWIWYDLWCLLPIYHYRFGLCIRDNYIHFK